MPPCRYRSVKGSFTRGIIVVDRSPIIAFARFFAQPLLLQYCRILHFLQAELLHACVEVHHLLLKCGAILCSMTFDLCSMILDLGVERCCMSAQRRAQHGNLTTEESEVMLQIIIACTHADQLLDNVPRLSTETSARR